MLTINLVCVGNLKEKFWQDTEREYAKRLSKFCNLKIIEIEEANEAKEIDKILAFEGKSILSHCKGYGILMAIEGKNLSSEDFAKEIQSLSLETSQITFVIGGSYGVSKEVKDKILKKISFGKSTFPHNLARIMLLEQIYRAFMINSGAKYHK